MRRVIEKSFLFWKKMSTEKMNFQAWKVWSDWFVNVDETSVGVVGIGIMSTIGWTGIVVVVVVVVVVAAVEGGNGRTSEGDDSYGGNCCNGGMKKLPNDAGGGSEDVYGGGGLRNRSVWRECELWAPLEGNDENDPLSLSLDSLESFRDLCFV